MGRASNDCPLVVKPHQICPQSAMDPLCDLYAEFFHNGQISDKITPTCGAL